MMNRKELEVEFYPQGILLREIAEETDLDTVLSLTGADIRIPPADIPRF